jgi:ribosomal protein S18 acetylase RimI-like enzyme
VEVYGGLQFERFTEEDVDILTPIMKRAFDEDTQRHLNQPTGGPDGYDNGDFLREYALNPASQAYKVSKEGKPIGAVIVWIKENNVNFLGNIFIDPEFQDKGLGLIIWKFIESKYPDTVKWYTDTPGFSRRNHNFYVNKCGFKVVKIKNPRDKYNGTYILEKEMK